MSDSEDDYMSDKLLNSCLKEDIRPSLLFSSSEKRKLELHKKKEEQRTKKPKTYKEQEEEAREKGLSTAITSENKGFKLLEKMGYKSGAALGKSQEGLKEPITITLKEGKSGVGKQKADSRKLTEMMAKMREKTLDNRLKEFRATKYQESVLRQIEKDLRNAQKVCEDLDYKANMSEPLEEFYWRPETILAMKAKEKEDEDVDESEEPEEIVDDGLTEERLFTVVRYLRSKYLYCMYCSITGVDETDLNSYCPGPFRIDHNDDD